MHYPLQNVIYRWEKTDKDSKKLMRIFEILKQGYMNNKNNLPRTKFKKFKH